MNTKNNIENLITFLSEFSIKYNDENYVLVQRLVRRHTHLLAYHKF